MVAKYFAGIPPAKLPPPPDLTEPRQEKEKTATRKDPLANRPALAFSYHMPPRNSPEYFAMGLLDQMLVQGDDSLLYQELVKKRGFTGEVSGAINELGNMFDYDGPMLWTASLFHDANVKPEQILSAVDTVIESLQSKPVDQSLLDRSITKMRSSLYDTMTQFGGFGRADLMACYALFDDDPASINSLEAEFRKVTPQLIEQHRARVSAQDQPHRAADRAGRRAARRWARRNPMRLLWSVMMLSAMSGEVFAGPKETPPQGPPPKPFHLPATTDFTLPNGMQVTIVPYGIVPKVAVRAYVAAGAIDESAEQVWLSKLNAAADEGRHRARAPPSRSRAKPPKWAASWKSTRVPTSPPWAAWCSPISGPNSSRCWRTC